MPKLIDAHTHAQFAVYGDKVDEVIRRALDEDIWLVNVGTQRDTSENAIEIAEKYPEGVYATVGIHPTHTSASHHDKKELGDTAEAAEFTKHGEKFDHVAYKALAENKKVVAIGECGLDYFRLTEDSKDRQIAAFIEHLNLSNEVGKPLMIHCREAFKDLIDTLETHKDKLLPNKAGIIHFMSGTIEDALVLMEFGFSFSFGGVITFTKDYDELVRRIGLERIVLETDAPYVAPIPHRGKQNEPAFVKFTAERLADILDTSLEKVAEATTQNARELFEI